MRSHSSAMAAALEGRILFIRGHRVMLDGDLALPYGVSTKRLNEQVRRNPRRFPPDFAFHLNSRETRNLRSQIATSSWGGRRNFPCAFTEHGAVMLASVLSSPTAIQASLEVVRAFIRLRELLGKHASLTRRLDELESRYDGQFKVVFDAIRGLMTSPDDPPPRRVGFHSNS